MKKVVISYAKEDMDFAKKIYEYLVKNETIPWLDCMDILPGQNWKEMISNAIKESSFFLALLSKNSLSKRGYVQKELKMAFDILEELPVVGLHILIKK